MSMLLIVSVYERLTIHDSPSKESPKIADIPFALLSVVPPTPAQDKWQPIFGHWWYDSRYRGRTHMGKYCVLPDGPFDTAVPPVAKPLGGEPFAYFFDSFIDLEAAMRKPGWEWEGGHEVRPFMVLFRVRPGSKGSGYLPAVRPAGYAPFSLGISQHVDWAPAA